MIYLGYIDLLSNGFKMVVSNVNLGIGLWQSIPQSDGVHCQVFVKRGPLGLRVVPVRRSPRAVSKTGIGLIVSVLLAEIVASSNILFGEDVPYRLGRRRVIGIIEYNH